MILSLQTTSLAVLRTALAACAVCGLVQSALAAPVLPNLATAPVGWTTDRYDPVSFGNVGTYQGRSDVLGISIDSSTDLANRAPGFNSSFYNTQGRQTVVTGGAGSVIAADLYIESAWGNGTNGYVRSDIWGVMTDATNTVSGYPIIGFTNQGGVGRLRVFDGDLLTNGGWVDLNVAFGGWTALAIEFTGSSFDFFVNGTMVYSDLTINGSTGFSAAILQAYNFADPSRFPGISTTAYTAHWSNAQVAAVPEPGSLALLAVALTGLVATQRRKAR